MAGNVVGVKAVVGRPHDERVVGNAQIVERVKKFQVKSSISVKTSPQLPRLVLLTYSGSGNRNSTS